jgi:hypothetical protein
MPYRVTDFARLQDIPGVGPSIAEDLRRLDIHSPSDLIGADPQELYERWMMQSGVPERCMLYVFRCAVYCTNTAPSRRQEKKMLWWSWKDSK